MRNGQKRDFARGLRQTMTDAEHRLWHHLRGRRLLGWKFRRQFPVGRYIADFASPEAGLIVELDGGQHNGCIRDGERDAFLQAQGFTVLRFWNNDVLTDTDAVLQAIVRALPRVPSPPPLLGSASPRQAAPGPRSARALAGSRTCGSQAEPASPAGGRGS